MKRTILSLLVFFVATMTWADDITAQEALQQAQSFIKQREANGSRPKRVKGSAASQLTMVKQVSGLYLFNVNDDGGFVIVSNDDSTVPILGFSDSGAIDPDNMPSNMRAWLQGYADEIEWAKKHIVASPLKALKASNAGAVKAPRRVGSHSTTAIAPLVTTKWDQDSPYNDLCPEYSSGYKSATGCVATAMAQVMKYHQWPQAATKTIPSYYCSSLSQTLSSLPATTFDWANMLDEYSKHWTGSNWQSISDGTTTQRTAVATLMQYCGWSVEMDYYESSASNTNMVVNALKKYFDYKSTTQFVSRSFYTSAKWADLIYHELANQRPVVYGGQSTGGGHEFVCDGYKYESSTDFFHINWGWGGMSDEYFVLSALDPDAQGIGGSSSNDGFHYGQDAVIGIQPSTGTGTVADISPNVVNLTLNSMTPARNPTIANMKVDITLNMTNNSSDDYDGDIYIGYNSGSGYSLLAGSNFFIASGETKDIVIPFVPSSAGTYNLVLFLPNTIGSYSTNGTVYASLVVTQSQTNEYVPIYGYYCDNYSRSQFVIPATDLEDLANTNLTGVTFYSSDQSVSWGDAEFDVYLSEVSGTTLSSLQAWNGLEKVYSGKLSISDYEMTITFDEPYQYKGGNLLVGINQTKSGSYKSCTWVGKTVSGASVGGYGTSINQKNFLPITTFAFEENGGLVKPTNVVASNITGSSANIAWTGSSDDYNVQYRTAGQDPVIFKDDFESGLGQWTIYTEGEARYEDGWYVTNPNNGLNFDAYSGSYVAGSFSWNSAAYNADNWLVTPQVIFGNELRFWVRTNASWPDKYEVLLSTTGNATSDFIFPLQTMAAAPTNGAWNEVVIDLSTFTGQQGYIAIHHVDYNMNYLLIDDFGIYGVAKAAGDWQTTSATQENAFLSGLIPETTYEVQVQAVTMEGTSAWSKSATFTTNNIKLGDANSDGGVTITDAVGIVNCILGNPSSDFNKVAANVNGDLDEKGEPNITITDAVGVVNIILNNGSSAPKMETPDAEPVEATEPE